MIPVIAAFAAGLLLAGIPLAIVLNLVRNERNRLHNKLAEEQSERVRLESERDADRRIAEEKLAAFRESEARLRETFSALSADALKSNTSQFLEIAREVLGKAREAATGDLDQRREAIDNLVKPLAESLKKYEVQIQEMEKLRQKDYGSLNQQVESLLKSEQLLQQRTGQLADALRKPYVRGRWGELQLRKIVEYAGMLEHCDFEEQVPVRTDEGTLRPDMVVHMPGGLNIVVDAKTPLDAYLDALNADDDTARAGYLRQHAQNVNNHIKVLAGKEYWRKIEQYSPDFVVMFIPGEPFYLAALQEDPSLLNAGVENRVILAAPTTLVALLKVAAYGWRQAQLAENARRISELGCELYDRVAVLANHLQTLGKHIDNSVAAYNRTVGALESRVLVTARRFSELGVETSKEVAEIEPVESQTRGLNAPELQGGEEDT